MMLIEQLERNIASKRGEISRWVEFHCEKVMVPLYSSVDLRFSEHKIAPIDTNVFPAGFNNLSAEFRKNAGKLFRKYLFSRYPSAEKILLVPELNTKNAYYWENVWVIKSVLEDEGYEVRVGIANEEFRRETVSFTSASGQVIEAKRVFQEEGSAMIDGFMPDIIMINNDFSEKCPKTLHNLRQPVLPPVEIGWHARKKDVHFEFYNRLCGELADILEVDPWVMSVETVLETGVDFDFPEDRERVSRRAGEILSRVGSEYSRREIDHEPSLFVKSNSGTYGMAVASVSDPRSIVEMNSRDRKRMRVSKGGVPVRDVVIQEGVPTSLRVGDGLVGEPVVYLVQSQVAGMFYRVNPLRGELENLNSKGMEFLPCDDSLANGISPAFDLVSRVATIAAGYEIEKVLRDVDC